MIDAYLPDHGDPAYHVEHYDLELDYRIAAGRLTVAPGSPSSRPPR